MQPGFAGCFVLVQESVSNDWAILALCSKYNIRVIQLTGINRMALPIFKSILGLDWLYLYYINRSIAWLVGSHAHLKKKSSFLLKNAYENSSLGP